MRVRPESFQRAHKHRTPANRHKLLGQFAVHATPTAARHDDGKVIQGKMNKEKWIMKRLNDVNDANNLILTRSKATKGQRIDTKSSVLTCSLVTSHYSLLKE